MLMLFLMMMMMMMFLVAVTNQIFLLIAQFPASKRRYRKKLVIFLPFFWRQRFTWKVQQNFPTFQYFQSSYWQRSFWFKCFKGSHVRLHNACKINFCSVSHYWIDKSWESSSHSGKYSSIGWILFEKLYLQKRALCNCLANIFVKQSAWYKYT